MTPTPDSIWSLDHQHLGRMVWVFDCVDSTNSLALSLSTDAAMHGLAFLARAQTAGRGQYGRTWQSPPGSSVLLSILLHLPRRLQRPALLTAWAAVSVCETIGVLTGLPTQIKWPNDILVHGKKICGILIEQRTTGQAAYPLATVVGIGLNVTQAANDFNNAGLQEATSLSLATAESFDFEQVAKTLLQQLDEHYQLVIDDKVETLEARWNAGLGLLGKTVVAESMQQRHHGRLVKVDFAGLELETPSGEKIHLSPESIRQLRALE